MNRKLKAIAISICGVTLVTAAKLNAQSVDVLSPTVVPARFTSNESPYTQSTMPLGDVPEGVTTYFWPEKAAAPTVAKKSSSVAMATPKPVTYSRTSFRPTNDLPPASYPAASANSQAPTVPATWTTQAQYAPPSSLPSSLPAASLPPTLRPEDDGIAPRVVGSAPPPTTGSIPNGGIPCMCVPMGQPTYSYFAPQPTYVYRQSLPVSQLPGNYYFGRGLIGQPKVYVPGQPVRNAIRYISP